MDDRFDIGRDAATAAGSHQRSAGRDSMFLNARVTRTVGPTLQLRVRNLSMGGMMAETDHLFLAGEAVTVELRSVGTVTARVAWVRSGRVGMAFDNPIDPSLVRKPPPQSLTTAMLPRPAPTAVKRPKLKDG